MQKIIFIICILVFSANIFLVRDTYAYTTKGNTVITKVGSPKGGVHPTPPDTPDSALAQALKDKFGISMENLDVKFTRWAWSFFWKVSDTKFVDLVKGSVIGPSDNPKASYLDFCIKDSNLPTDQSGDNVLGGGGHVSMVTDPEIPETTWDAILAHEMGHALSLCNPRSVVKWNEHRNIVSGSEGSVSYYGANAETCGPVDPRTGKPGANHFWEDYAETVSLYLVQERGNTVCGVSMDSVSNPFYGAAGNTKPQHFSLINSVIGDFIP